MIIYKYPLRTLHTQEVEMLAGAKILTVQSQDDVICIWVEVNEAETKTEKRTFNIRGTGYAFSDVSEVYIGTVQLQKGILVFHVYESKIRS